MRRKVLKWKCIKRHHMESSENQVCRRLLREAEIKMNMWCFYEIVSHQWLDCRTGLSFWAMWYKALIAFMLNKGGFLSAVKERDRMSRFIEQPQISCFYYIRRVRFSSSFFMLLHKVKVICQDDILTFMPVWLFWEGSLVQYPFQHLLVKCASCMHNTNRKLTVIHIKLHSSSAY